MINKTKDLATSILERVSLKTKNLSSGKTKIRIERVKSSVSMRITTKRAFSKSGTPKPIVIIVNATKTHDGHKINQVQTNHIGDNKDMAQGLENLQDILIKLINKGL